MFDKLFENRNQYVSSLIKIGSSISRSLRKNVSLYSIDSNRGRVHYLSEDNNLIYGDIKITEEDKLSVVNIKISDASNLENEDKFDNMVLEQVENLITSVFNSEYSTATGEFDEILSLWESRSKFEREKERLQEKSVKFANTRILSDPIFNRIDEIYSNLVEFLQENKGEIIAIPEISNSIRLSNTISTAFDCPRLGYDDLEGTKIEEESEFNSSIYEIVCSQELLSEELLEAKRNFSNVWATNAKIKTLATCIFEQDEEAISLALSEAIEEVPFLALASKKQIRDTVSSYLDLIEEEVSNSDLVSFVSTIFEMKKPVKKEIVNFLNEKYGINNQNLNDIPSFKSLLNTQVLLFESLQKLSPKGSVQKEVLKEIATLLKTKTGVESIDVNTLITTLFEESGYEVELDVELPVTTISIDEATDSERIKELIGVVSEAKVAKKKEPKVKVPEEEEQETPEEGEEAGETENPMSMHQGSFVSKEDFMNNLKELEDLLQDLVDNEEPETDDKELEEPKETVKEEGEETVDREESDEPEEEGSTKKKSKKKVSKKKEPEENKAEQYEE